MVEERAEYIARGEAEKKNYEKQREETRPFTSRPVELSSRASTRKTREFPRAIIKFRRCELARKNYIIEDPTLLFAIRAVRKGRVVTAAYARLYFYYTYLNIREELSSSHGRLADVRRLRYLFAESPRA